MILINPTDLTIATTCGTFGGFGIGFYYERHKEGFKKTVSGFAIFISALLFTAIMLGNILLSPSLLGEILNIYVIPKIASLMITILFGLLSSGAGKRFGHQEETP